MFYWVDDLSLPPVCSMSPAGLASSSQHPMSQLSPLVLRKHFWACCHNSHLFSFLLSPSVSPAVASVQGSSWLPCYLSEQTVSPLILLNFCGTWHFLKFSTPATFFFFSFFLCFFFNNHNFLLFLLPFLGLSLSFLISFSLTRRKMLSVIGVLSVLFVFSDCVHASLAILEYFCNLN